MPENNCILSQTSDSLVSIIKQKLKLSSDEQKLMDIILSQINGDENAENTIYHLAAENYEKSIPDCTSHDIYKILRNGSIDLMKKDIVVKGTGKGRIFSIIGAVSWDESEETIDIELSRSAKKLFLSIIKNEPDALLENSMIVVTDVIEDAWADALIKFIGGRACISREAALAVVRKALESRLSQTQMKNRVNVILDFPNVKNFAGLCEWAMGSDFKFPSQVRDKLREMYQEL